MMSHPKSRIHKIAIETLQSCKNGYAEKTFNWFINDELEAQNQLVIFLDKPFIEDEEIIKKFETTLSNLQDKYSILYLLAKSFIEKAYLICENNQLKLQIKNNNEEKAKHFHDYNKNFSSCNFIFAVPELLENILLFLNLDDLRAMSLTTTQFNTIIINNGIEKKVIDIARQKNINPYSRGSLQLFFKMHAIGLEKTININVKPSDYIGHLKKAVEFREGLPAATQRYFLNSKVLEDDRKVNDYDIKFHDTISLVPRLFGD